MKRLANALVFAIALVLCASPSDAQQPGKVFRVGVLLFPSAQSVESRLNAFREGLRDLGYKEGQNLVLESRFANGGCRPAEQLPGISRVLVLSFLADPIAPIQVKAMERAAPSLGVSCKYRTFGRPMTYPPHSRLRAERVPKEH